MASYNNLKAAIRNAIYENGQKEITGDILQTQLLNMVTSLGKGYQFVGVATPSTTPIIGDEKIMYLASTAGTYSSFGGITLEQGEVAVLCYDAYWSKKSLGILGGGGSSGVLSFNGRTGNVTLTSSDISSFLVGYYNTSNANLASVDWTCRELHTNEVKPDSSNTLYFNATSFEFYSNSGTTLLVRDNDSCFNLTTYLGNNYIQSFNTSQTASADLYLTGLYSQNMPTLHLKADNTRAYGNFYATGQITAGTASDLRLKENIETLADFRKVLASLRGVSFDWKKLATEKCETLEGHDVGMIAQEVEELIPSAISPIFGDFKRLDYTKVIPYLVEGWKDQDTRITAMERKLDEIINLIKK